MDKIKVMVVDDHPAFRSGLSRLLEDEADFEVVGTAEDGDQSVTLASQLKPDVIVMDISMPRLNGIEAAKQIKANLPEVAILIVSAYNYSAYILAALKAGVAGYVSKNSALPALIKAVRLVNQGEGIFDLKTTGNILRKLALNQTDKTNGSGDLHEREVQVLTLVAKGIGNKQIASQLNLSERTVQTHLINIYRKLEVNSRTEAVLKSLKNGLLTLEDLSDKYGVRIE